MSEKKAKMIAAVNWPEQIEAIAGPYKGNRKAWIERAARSAGITWRQAKGLWYGEVKNPKCDVADSVRNAAIKARIEAGRLDAEKTAAQFETIAGGLLATDEDFHRDTIAALLGAARALRALDSA